MYQKIKTIGCVFMFSCLVGWQLVYAQLTEAQENLLEAVKAGDSGEVARLLDDDIDPNFSINEEGESLLFAVLEFQRSYALELENVSPEALNIFRLLLDAGANPNVRDGEGDFIIHQTIDYPEYLQVLIEHEGDPNAYNLDGWTPLHTAAEAGVVGAVRILLNAPGIDVNQQVRYTDCSSFEDTVGMTALHFAAEGATDWHNTILNLLLEAGADRVLLNDRGQTADMLIGDDNRRLIFDRACFLREDLYVFN